MTYPMETLTLCIRGLSWLRGSCFLVCASIWSARRHLVEVARSVTGWGHALDDSGEIMSYRTAVFGFLLASLFAVVWLSKTGLGYGSALFY